MTWRSCSHRCAARNPTHFLQRLNIQWVRADRILRSKARLRAAQPTLRCQRVPPRVGLEAIAVPLRQPFELVPDAQRATRTRVMQRPAAKGSKSGGEDHGGIERVLV